MSTAQYRDVVLYRRLAQQARPYWPHMAGIFVLDLIATPLALLGPIPLKIAVDSVIGSAPLPRFLAPWLSDQVAASPIMLLGVVAGMQVLVVLLMQLQELGRYVLATRTGEGLTLDFQSRLFRHTQRLSLLFHDGRGTADSIYRIQYDAPTIQWISIYGVLPLLSAGLMLVAMLYVTARIDWQLALVALAVVPFLFCFSHTYNRHMRGRYGDAKILASNALRIVQEVLTSVRVVKAFGREDSEQERFVRQSSEGVRARVWLSFAEGVLGLLINLTTAVGTAVVLFVGIRNVQTRNLTLGELLMVMTYLAQLYGPLKTISQKAAELQSSLASAQRAFELLDQAPDVVERSQAQRLKRATGTIELRQVSFAYDARNPVLRDVSCRIGAGTRVGVMGRTGAGKTTFVGLITRFYDPNMGQVLLDGIDLRDYRLADLRNQFAIVLQEPVLFATSIAENITYARPSASQQEVVEAAKAANVHDFITNLSDGYDTLVGERGMRLSGGERQRIALARAFLKDAPILILDEPTSSVDRNTEAGIINALERLMRGRTTLMIAHRLSTLEHCDVVLEIEAGRLVTLTADVAPFLEEASRLGRDHTANALDRAT
jgi:ATP-binding cassette subfamily B protein